jgi:dihydrolipoamide dehydrogenase
MSVLRVSAHLFRRSGLLAGPAARPAVAGGPVGARARLLSAPADEQDLVVAGGGPGGYAAAIKAAQLGLKVTCVEKRGALGGTCLNVGCIPSKALLHSSHLYEDARTSFGAHGIRLPGGVELDLPTMMGHKEASVDGLTKGIEGLFKKNNVTYVKGTASISGAGAVRVALTGGGEASIKTKNVLLATGSEVASLPSVPIDEETIVSSTGALKLKAVPDTMIVIGGGVIGLEMGSVWRRLGAEVTVVEFLDRLVPGVDKEIASTFQRILKKQKMKFKMSTKVVASRKEGGKVVLDVEAAKGGKPESLKADIVLVATGRRPYTDGLGLPAAGVKMDDKGRVLVDAKFQTSVPGVYAIGDIIAGPMLAHKAEDEGLVAAEIIAGAGEGHVNYDCIPGVIYTHPEVATVGKTEEDLVAAGAEFNKGTFPFAANSRARTNDVGGDYASGMVKVLSDKATDRVLGVHIVGPNAGELIAEAVLAMEYGASSEDIARTCHAHPTLSEAVREAAMATRGKAIHF